MNLLQMSFSGAVLILAIIAVRALTIRRLPKKTFSILWKIAALRLLIPVSLPSVFSVYTYLGRALPPRTAAPAATLPASVGPDFNTPAPTAFGTPQTASPALPPSTAQAGGPSVWFFVWCIGMAVCALFFLVSYIACRRNFKTALPAPDGYVTEWQKEQTGRRRVAIRCLGGIHSPLTYGIWKPVILLPKSTDWSDTGTLKYILTHEYTHILRLDALTKLLFTAALCIHWFNPLVFAMFLLSNRDTELACDEEVLFRLGETSKTPYALALIHMEECRSGLTLLYNNFSKNSVEERIRCIMKHKKLSKPAVAAAILIVFALTAAFATSPAKAKEGAETVTNPAENEDAASNVEMSNDFSEDASYGVDITSENTAENNKFEFNITKTFEVHLAPGEETELETISIQQGQVIVVTQMCEGTHNVGIKLDGSRLSSAEARVENFGIFTSECLHAQEDRNLIVYNPGTSDLDIRIGYLVLEAEEYNQLGTWDLLRCLKKEYQDNDQK